MLKRLSMLTGLVAALTLALTASPALANSDENRPPPPGNPPDATRAYVFYEPRTTTMSATGSTAGWRSGHISIRATLTAPNGYVQWSRGNDCDNMTYCTLPTYTFCPSQRGKWTMYVIAYGPGGSEDAVDTAIV